MTQDAASSRRSTVAAPKVKKQTSENLPGMFVGWISKRWGIAWVVSPHRADKRTGAIDTRPMSTYAKELIDPKKEKVKLPYNIAYSIGGGRGRGRTGQTAYHFFEASHDYEAWQLATAFMVNEGVSEYHRRQALLYQEDREVQGSYAKQ